ncbi:MAG: ArsI/CadI family heavy metal resistance metalloenzyme [Adhaeribacter sp.]
MKRLHVHVRVKNLDESVAFYNALFAASPTVLKPDYAKWLLEDPRVNFAISLRSDKIGLEHLGIQAESPEELNDIYGRLVEAKGTVREEGQTTCCYAQSEKSWITDPQGIDWEAFYTFGSSTTYAEPKSTTKTACCEPTCCEK